MSKTTNKTFIRIEEGTYRSEKMDGKVFPLVADFKETDKGSKFVTVDGSTIGRNNIRVSVNSRSSFTIVSEEDFNKAQTQAADIAKPVELETDEEIDERIKERFDVLDMMTQATINGDVRGMIVTGPPGVGKSFGVEAQLEKASLFDKVAGRKTKYHFVKGASTALGLYANLYNYSDAGSVIVFDDCDGVLQDEVCLNLLKGALDSGKKRRLAWNSSSSSFLEKEGIPEDFLFEGAVIFITNIKFDNVRSAKIRDHLEALMSRCHYLDLTMDSMKEKLIRIRQVASEGQLFKDYGFSKAEGEEVLDYMQEFQDKFREMSLRTCLKVADLKKIAPKNWKALARSTCMKRF